MAKRELKKAKIKAEFVRETKDSLLLDYGGNLTWFPKKEVSYNRETNELEATKKLLKKLFPETEF